MAVVIISDDVIKYSLHLSWTDSLTGIIQFLLIYLVAADGLSVRRAILLQEGGAITVQGPG